ncbi:hypothetical protein CsatB_013630 [Cannabis sativa]
MDFGDGNMKDTRDFSKEQMAIRKKAFSIIEDGGELCDLIVPFARFVAMNGITSFIAKVCRRDNPSKGRYHEFYQCDFDIAGQLKEWGQILTELLDELEIGKYEIKLNHLKLLDGMLEICGVPPGKFRTICSSIDKLDKQPFDQIKTEIFIYDVTIGKSLFRLKFDFIDVLVTSCFHVLSKNSILKRYGEGGEIVTLNKV